MLVTSLSALYTSLPVQQLWTFSGQWIAKKIRMVVGRWDICSALWFECGKDSMAKIGKKGSFDSWEPNAGGMWYRCGTLLPKVRANGGNRGQVRSVLGWWIHNGGWSRADKGRRAPPVQVWTGNEGGPDVYTGLETSFLFWVILINVKKKLRLYA